MGETGVGAGAGVEAAIAIAIVGGPEIEIEVGCAWNGSAVERYHSRLMAVGNHDDDPRGYELWSLCSGPHWHEQPVL